MTISRTTIFSEILSAERISDGALVYLRQRLRNRLHNLVLEEFIKRENAGTLTKADLARRIGKRPEQITRWLGVSGNWTLDTISDLLAAMGGELEPAFTSFADRLSMTFQPQLVMCKGQGNLQESAAIAYLTRMESWKAWYSSLTGQPRAVIGELRQASTSGGAMRYEGLFAKSPSVEFEATLAGGQP
jgi:DNA-binding phage protein